MKDQFKTKQSLIQESASLEYAKSIINTVREPLIILDHDLRVVTASRSFYEFFKVQPDETVGQLIYDLGDKQWDIPKLRELLETILPKKITFDNYEVEHDFVSVGRRKMLLNARQIERVLGKEKIILLAIEDITERKRLENILTESEDRFRRVFETASDGILLLEKSAGTITHANPASEKMLGYTQKEIIGNKLQDIGVFLDKGDFQTTMLNLNKFGIINYRDVKIETKSGQNIDTDIYLADGTKLVQCNIRDIADRKRMADMLLASEEQYRTFFNTSRDCVFITSTDGSWIDMNDAAVELFGYSSKDELMQVSIFDLYAKKEDRAKLINTIIEYGHARDYPVDLHRKDGRIIHTLITSAVRYDAHGRTIGIMGTIKDITERKRSEDMLRQQTDAMDSAIDGMAILNKDEEYVYVNKAHVRIYGYENEGELIGKSWRILYDSDVIQRFEQEFMPEFSRKGYWFGESIGKKKNGSKFPQAVSLTAMANGGLICVVRDITESKRSEELLKQSEVKYRLLADNISDVIFVLDMNLKYTYISPSTKYLRGYEPEEVMKLSIIETLAPHSMDLAIKTLSDVMEQEKIKQIELGKSRTIPLEMKRKDGTTVWTEVKFSFIRDKDKQPVGILGVTRDITERKKASEILQASEEQYRLVVENAKESIIIIQDRKMVFVNRAVIGMLGYSKEILTSKSFTDFIHPDDINLVIDRHIKRLKGEEVLPVYSFRVISQDGTVIWFEINAVLIQWKGKPATLSFLNDITERKRAEDELRESENKYRLLADNVNDVIFVMDMNLHYTYVSPSVKIIWGYEPSEVVKQQAFETLMPASIDLAVKTLSEVMELEKSEHRDINISRTLPLETIRKDGTTVWTEVKFSFIRDKDKQPVGILGVTRDITERRKADEELQQTLVSLNNAFGTTVQVLISAIESRDPYTSGHQLRAANLACAIANEMELPKDKIEGLQMAGSIHDIGKLSIPAEILSKPNKLTTLEFSLIKEHPQRGYEMLKDVKSPWPLAQIVHQHHERMDGSGYPGNLKGDEILMEARIMAVADVVEAMGSHRPYRASLGIDAALAEIEKNKGTRYDITVADACLRLFREKGYQLT